MLNKLHRTSELVRLVRRGIAGLLLAAAASACAPGVLPATPIPTLSPTTATLNPSATPAATATTSATPTASPTVAPTQTPTATPSPTVTDTPAPKLLLDEHFADNRNRWSVGPTTDGAADVEIADGAMVITMTKPNLEYTLSPQLSGAVSDLDQTVVGSVSAKPSQKVDVSYGLACRVQQAGRYTFEVHANGTYFIGRFDAGPATWATLAKGDSNGVVQPPPATNSIRAVCAGSQFTLIVNGQLLASVQDDTLRQGTPGLIAGNNAAGPATAKFESYRVLSPEQHFYSQPATSVAGRLLYLLQAPGTQGYDIVTADSDGSHVAKLTKGQDGHAYDAVWSPDGQKIAYSWLAGNPVSGNLYVMNADGSGKTALTKTDSTQTVGNLSWSPDGKQIAFDLVTNTGTYLGTDVGVIDTDGTHAHAVTDIGLASNPAWSPNGQQIAFISDLNGQTEIHVIDADGTHDTNLTHDPVGEAICLCFTPAWSPDGLQLAFVTTRDGDQEIYVMRPDGSQQTRLTFKTVNNANPSWSPDGKTIVFSAVGSDQQHLGLYVMNADGSGYTALPSGAGDADRPHLRP